METCLLWEIYEKSAFVSRASRISHHTHLARPCLELPHGRNKLSDIFTDILMSVRSIKLMSG